MVKMTLVLMDRKSGSKSKDLSDTARDYASTYKVDSRVGQSKKLAAKKWFSPVSMIQNAAHTIQLLPPAFHLHR